jgi:hypothetical protein
MKVGDQMRMGPPGYPVNQVIALERGRWLLMAGANLKTGIADLLPQPGQTTYINYTWLLYLDEQADGTTCLISRTHLDYAPRPFAAKLMWEVFIDRVCDDAQNAANVQTARLANASTGRRRLGLAHLQHGCASEPHLRYFLH